VSCLSSFYFPFLILRLETSRRPVVSAPVNNATSGKNRIT
jgi:hypothetical protein